MSAFVATVLFMGLLGLGQADVPNISSLGTATGLVNKNTVGSPTRVNDGNFGLDLASQCYKEDGDFNGFLNLNFDMPGVKITFPSAVGPIAAVRVYSPGNSNDDLKAYVGSNECVFGTTEGANYVDIQCYAGGAPEDATSTTVTIQDEQRDSGADIEVCEVDVLLGCEAGTYFDAGGLECNTCPLGHYCPGFSAPTWEAPAVPCAAGLYGSQHGLTSPVCSGVCNSGHVCPEGSTSPNEVQCGSNNVYCAGGVAYPVLAGFYSIGGDSDTRSAQSQCTAGTYCVEGVQSLCPAGRYGVTDGEDDPDCTGVCTRGYFCPPGSTSPTQEECGALKYCPAGTETRQDISTGYYGIGDAVDGVTTFYDQEQCISGEYCTGGEQFLCSPGFYGTLVGESRAGCEGPCSAGYYCPAGSNTPTASECGGETLYCPAQSAAPLTVTDGHHTVGGSSTTRSGQLPCAAGEYCQGGVRFFCPAGRFGEDTLEDDDQCTGECKAGYYCSEASTKEDQIECGSSKYCPTGSGSPITISTGFFGVGATPTTYTSQTICPAGSFCTNGLAAPCLAGFFGATQGASSGNCDAACDPGYYCETGSTDRQQFPCGGPNVFCPRQSSAPELVQSGYYSVGGTNSTRTGELECQAGTYCEDGLRMSCPAGRYGATAGETDMECTGDCDAGYYCPAGSSNPQQIECGIQKYCPPASGSPVAIRPGYYGIGGTVTTFTGEAQCGPGTFCSNGEQVQCLLGFFGSTFGLFDTSCDGPCEPGYYCPRGSTSPFQVECGGSELFCGRQSGSPSTVQVGYYSVGNTPTNRTGEVPCEPGHYCIDGVREQCPGGRYGEDAQEVDPLCTGLCFGGYYCTPGSASATAQQCGGDDVYCPEGSSEPLAVGPGYYSSNGLSGRKASRTLCKKGQYCPGDGLEYLCPVGRFGNTTGLQDGNCTGTCNVGSFCEPGSQTAEGQRCPPGSYCLATGIFPCPVGRYYDEEGAARELDCKPCPAGTFNSATGVDALGGCLPCAAFENSTEAAEVCWPGVVAVAADNPEPINPGVTAADTVTVYFTKATNVLELSTLAAVQAVVSFNVDLTTGMDGRFRTVREGEPYFEQGATWALVITLSGTVVADPFQSRIGGVTAEVLATGGLTDAGGLSGFSRTPAPIMVNGTWGAASIPVVTHAAAVDGDGLPGLGVGDSLLFSFSIFTNVPPPEGAVTFTPPLPGATVADWVTASVLNITLVSADAAVLSNTTFQEAAAVGSLAYAVNPAANIRPADESTDASSSQGVVMEGTWGDVPASIVALHHSHTSLRITLSPPTTKFGYAVSGYALDVSPDASFAGAQTVPMTAAVADEAATSTVVSNLTLGQAYFVRAAALFPGLSYLDDAVPALAPLSTPSLGPWLQYAYDEDAAGGNVRAVLCGDCGDNCCLLTRLPAVTSVEIRGAGMATTGGERVTLEGTGFGLDSALLASWYTNGNRTYHATGCELVDGPTEKVDCFTTEGVGGGFRWGLAVNGGMSPLSAVATSYFAPVVTSFAGAGSPAEPGDTNGGQVVRIQGTHFGRADDTLIDSVVYSPVGREEVVFSAYGCNVTADHFDMECFTAEGAGTQLSWTITIANQSSVTATTSYQAPAITGVELEPGPWSGPVHANCTVCDAVAPGAASLSGMATSGLQLVALMGTGFGPQEPSNFLEAVSYTNPATLRTYIVPTDNCYLAEAHHRLVCATVPGVGTGFRWAITVLGQQSPLSPNSDAHVMSYLAPAVDAVTVASGAATVRTNGGDTLRIMGSSFGHDPQLIEVVLHGEPVAFTLVVPHAELQVTSPEIQGPTRALTVLVRILGAEADAPPIVVGTAAIGSLAITFATDDVVVNGTLGACGPADIADGDIVRVEGSNFGVDMGATTLVVGTLSAKLCALEHDRLWCVARVRTGILRLAIETDVGVQSETAEYVFADLMRSPAPTGIAYDEAPTAGGTAVTISGTQFKTQGEVWFEHPSVRPSDATADVAPSAIPCVVEGGSYSETEVVCTMPAGVGAGYTAVVVGNGIIGRSPRDVTFSYAAPVLAEVSPVEVPSAGAAITLTGTDFGVWPANVSVSVGGMPCVVAGVDGETVTCEAPAGTAPSAAVVATVAGQSTAEVVTVAYSRPAVNVSTVVPTHGPSSGGFLLRLNGTNFGPPGTPVRVELRRPDLDPLLCDPTTGVNGSSFSHYHIVCVVPTLEGGPGAGLELVVNTGSQASAEAVVFSFDPPHVEAVLIPNGSAPTIGDFLVRILGSSFTLEPTVTVGGSPCVITASDHASIECEAPSGVGANQSVVVVAGGQTSAPHGTAVVHYDPPVITSVSPLTLGATASTQLDVFGRNFGALRGATERTIVIGDQVTCVAEFLGDHHIRCSGYQSDIPAGGSLVVGTEPVMVHVAGQRSVETALVEFTCPVGSYGSFGDTCTTCPFGATCLGGRNAPTPLTGFFPVSSTEFLQCVPPQACPGGINATCAPAYTGVPCSECAPRHFRLEDKCEPCPNLAWLYLVAFFVAITLVLLVAVWMARRQINLAGLSIGVDFAQTLAMVSSFQFSWPVELMAVFNTVSASNFNIQIVAPECSVAWSFEQKFYLISAIPICLLVVIFTAMAGYKLVMVLAKARRRRVRRIQGIRGMATPPGEDVSTDSGAVDVMGGVAFAAMYYLYLQVVKNSLTLFDCSGDGDQRVMDAEPAISCTQDDERYRELYPVAVLGFVGYSIGIPVVFGFVLFKYKDSIRADQRLRALGRGFTTSTNPNLHVRRRFQKLYNDFAPERHYWRLVLLARKLALAFTTIMFNTYLLFQASVSIAVMFAAYVLHARFKPFLPRASVNKAFLDTQEFRNAIADSAPPNMTAKELDAWVDTEVANAKRRLSYTFDYNGLEAACLISATTVLLSGMVFESAAFEVGSTPYRVLTALVIIVMLAAIIGFVTLMGYEVYRSVRYSVVVRRSREKEILESKKADESSSPNPLLSGARTLNPLVPRSPPAARPSTKVPKVVLPLAATPGRALGLTSTPSMRWTTNPTRSLEQFRATRRLAGKRSPPTTILQEGKALELSGPPPPLPAPARDPEPTPPRPSANMPAMEGLVGTGLEFNDPSVARARRHMSVSRALAPKIAVFGEEVNARRTRQEFEALQPGRPSS